MYAQRKNNPKIDINDTFQYLFSGKEEAILTCGTGNITEVQGIFKNQEYNF